MLYLCVQYVMCLQKVEKLMRDSEDSKSNCQPQSSMDSTHQLNDKVDTLEAAQ